MSKPQVVAKVLPNWPRLLRPELAAAYVGESKTAFLQGIGTRWPQPIRRGRTVAWDRLALDAAIDRMMANGDAGVETGDPLMEALEI